MGKKENWEPIDNYNETYSVSDMGRVFNNKSGKFLTPSPNTKGYLRVGLTSNGKLRTITVHTLVAEYFIDKDYRSKGLVPNHKDFNRKNNKKSNLEVVTLRENGNQKHLESTSKYIGVCWNKSRKKWESKIKVGQITKYLGCFSDEKEASVAYEKALEYVNSPEYDSKWLLPTRVKTSRFKGVYFCSKSKQWRAQIYINGKNTNLGGSLNEEEAFAIYQKALNSHADEMAEK